MKNKVLNSGLKPIISFFLISHLLPFLTTIILMFFEKNLYISSQPHSNLIYFSLLSPTFAAFFVIYLFYSSKEKIDYLHRLIDVKRISNKWYFVIFSLPIIIRVTAALSVLLFPSTYFQFYFSPEMTLSKNTENHPLFVQT